MRNLFSMDSGLFRFLSKLADIMILNLLFIACCIPVFTIGAAVTALSYVTLKMRDEEEGYIWKSFFKSFRENFKQSTVIWLVMLVLACILALDFNILRSMDGTFTLVMRVLVYLGTLIWLMVFTYVFPLQSRFYNSIRSTFRNAVLLSLANFPKTFCMMVISVGAVALTFWNGYTLSYGLLIWILMGFSGIAFINSFFMHGIIKKLMPPEETEGEEAETSEEA